ncbi:hypothetical protein [Shinella sp. WSJ-2]|uniref:hypothetical protein n=1 Tax=Shinella sp. WSJ-2 TaxID=2303749 RepID=UPI0011C15E20|nr:hypothetical protein [Shinella sp. WSJ-2]
MKVLVVATSPLQVQNGIQYIRQTNGDFSRSVLAHVGSARDEDNERALTIANREAWARIGRFPPFRPLRSKDFVTVEDWRREETSNRAIFIEEIARFFTEVGTSHFETVLLGDYRPMSFRQFLQATEHGRPEVVLLDDGSVSRYVMRFRETGAGKEEATRGILPHLGAEDPFRIMEPTSLTYFTIYDEPIAQSDKILLNKQYEGAAYQDLRLLDNEVWICGANHVEARLAKQNEYIAICAAVRSWFPDKVVRYFPHRREQAEKLEIIQSKISANIEGYKYGIEEYVRETKTRPHRLVVFGSTVADTLSRAFAPSDTVVVATPSEQYFVKKERSDHIRNVIRDNLRSNTHVTGISPSTSNVGRWFSAESHMERVGRSIQSPGHLPDKPMYEQLDGLKRVTTKAGWARLCEQKSAHVHRAILGSFPGAEQDTAFLHVFKIRTEERYAFKLRLADAGEGGDFVEASAMFDVPGTHKRENDFGRIVLEIEVNSERISTVSVFFKAQKSVPTKLLLIALQGHGERVSRHRGIVQNGFSLARLLPREVETLSLPTSRQPCSVQTRLTPGESIFLVTRGHGSEKATLICIHSGHLTTLTATSLKMPIFGDFIIPIVHAQKADGLSDLLHGVSMSRPIVIASQDEKMLTCHGSDGVFAEIGLGPDIDVALLDFRSFKPIVLHAHESTSPSRERFGLTY